MTHEELEKAFADYKASAEKAMTVLEERVLALEAERADTSDIVAERDPADVRRDRHIDIVLRKYFSNDAPPIPAEETSEFVAVRADGSHVVAAPVGKVPDGTDPFTGLPRLDA